MNTSIRASQAAFPSRKQALAILAAGVLILAIAGSFLAYLALTVNEQVRSETYYYQLFVRMRNPGAAAELWVPVPDFPELQDRTYVDGHFADFPNTNVSQSILDSAYGTMFRFVFSDSFAAWGAMSVPPGSANGTLTFSSQVSNGIRIHLSNLSSGNQVSIILLYQVAQVRASMARDQVFFVGTTDPRGSPDIDLQPGCGYLLEIIHADNAYMALPAGWGLYPLTDGAFAYACD